MQLLQRLISAGAVEPQASAGPLVNSPLFPIPALPSAGSMASSNTEAAPRRTSAARQRASLLVWSLVGCGIMAFVCGAVLLAWSLITNRGELWTLGMPICLGGQLGLLLGLMFQ